MRKLLVLVLVLMQGFVVAAQVRVDFVSGYVVLTNNDTIFGDLKKLPYPNLIFKVQFKEKKALVDTTYTAKEIKAFHFDSGIDFEAIQIRSINPKDTSLTKYFALKKLAGVVDFFVLYLPNSEERFFVRNADYGLNELKQPIETVYNKVYSNKRYLSVLTKYLGGVPEFQSKVLSCSYYEGSFVKLISAYNDLFSGKMTKEPKKVFKNDLYFTGGLDNFLAESIDSKIPVFGYNFGLETSFSNKEKNLRSEFILGIKYSSYTRTQTFNSYLRRDTVRSDPPYQGISQYYYLYNESLRVIQTGQLLRLPMYLKYNNRLKMFSPVLEGGLEPFLLSTKFDAGNRGSYRSKLVYGLNLIIGIGLAFNQEHYRMKFMVYADPILMNALSVEIKI